MYFYNLLMHVPVLITHNSLVLNILSEFFLSFIKTQLFSLGRQTLSFPSKIGHHYIKKVNFSRPENVTLCKKELRMSFQPDLKTIPW